jgi:hypothetical protein
MRYERFRASRASCLRSSLQRGASQEPIRGAIEQLCKLVGAKHYARMTRDRTTHLICCVEGEASDKYQHALEWGMEVVTAEWLFQSVCRGRRQEERQYSTRDQREALAPPAAAAPSTLGERSTRSLLMERAPVAPAPPVLAPALPPVSHVEATPALPRDAPVVEPPAERAAPRATGKRKADEPEDMLEVVARLTRVVKRTGKRYASSRFACHTSLFCSELMPGLQASQPGRRAGLGAG